MCTIQIYRRCYDLHDRPVEVNIQGTLDLGMGERVSAPEHALMFCPQQQLQSTIVSTNNVPKEEEHSLTLKINNRPPDLLFTFCTVFSRNTGSASHALESAGSRGSSGLAGTGRPRVIQSYKFYAEG